MKRRVAIAVGLILAVPGAPLLAQADTSHVYEVTYGGKDLGSWNTLEQGRSTSGSYDGASFQSSGGAGYATVTLSRPLTAADRQSLWSSLPSANDRLVVRESRSGTIVSTTTCEKSMKDSFDASGNPGQANETLVFACTSIATTKPTGGTQ